MLVEQRGGLDWPLNDQPAPEALGDAILQVLPLGLPWPTIDPFLFCVHHDDAYPRSNGRFGPQASLADRALGSDFGDRAAALVALRQRLAHERQFFVESYRLRDAAACPERSLDPGLLNSAVQRERIFERARRTPLYGAHRHTGR